MVGRHYPELDGIRSIAILLVIFFHCRIIAAPQNPAEKIYYALVESGWIGVDLFFVLSGFLITGILLDTFKQENYFRNFYLRRILRIFPLYYAVLLLFTLLAAFGLLEFFEQKSAMAQASYWLYLQNWLALLDLAPTKIISHFWSLAIEEQFYLLWPALILFAARRNSVGRLGILTIILAFVVRVVFVHYEKLAYFFTFSRMDTLALGACVAVLLRQHGSLGRFRTAAFLLAAFSAVTVVTVGIMQKGFYGHDPEVLLYGLLPLGIFFASFLTIALTSNENGALRLFLRNEQLRMIGVISYGVYIFHWPIIVLVQPMWPSIESFWVNQLGFFALITVMSVLVAWFSYRFFEKPFLQLKDKIAPVQKG